MHLNGWKRWLFVIGFGLSGLNQSRAQATQKALSELDRLPVWHPHYRPSNPEFPGAFPGQPNAYASLSDLLQKAGAGSKIESLIITSDVLKQGGLPGLRQLQTVRVLVLNSLTQQQADSLTEVIQDWPLLERLSVNINQITPGKTETNPLSTLPDGIQRLPKLRDVRINFSGKSATLSESMRMLAGLKNLRHLELTNWQTMPALQVNLDQFRQLTGLKLYGQGWLIKPETLAGLTQLTELSLANVQLDTLTFRESLSGLSGLETLSLSNVRQLRKLALGSLKNLKAIELLYNPELTVDAATFAGLSGLERLIIRGYRSAELSGLCPLKNLRVLTISANGTSGNSDIKRSSPLPECIGQLTQLTELRVENRLLGQLPATIGSLNNLTQLTLNACGLDSLPASIGQLTALTELFLPGNKFRQLPALGQLQALRELTVSNNQLTALPDDIGQLTQLTTLNADQNKLTQLPASVVRLVNLQRLSVSNNQLERLPDALGNLHKLHWLTIGDNQLTALPGSIGQLDSLRTLFIGKNRLRTLPSNLARWKKLTLLMIGANELTALPSDFGKLRQLTQLSIVSNPITELPASVSELVNLESINIYGTQLRLLPDNIGALTKLRSVALVNNELIALPNSIGQWQEVAHLSLEQNRLQGLPNSIGRLTKLMTLLISGKEKAMEGATGGIQQLPDSLVYCTHLKQLTIRQQPQVDADDVFAKAARIKGLTNLTIANCNVSRLPAIAWKEVAWESLDVSQNLLTELPVDILDAPKLQFVTVSENHLSDVLNRGFYGKDNLRVAFAEAGVLPLGTLSKPNRKIGMAYQQMAAQKGGQRDWEGSLSDLQKAIDFMPDTALALPYSQRAELHFFRKEYTDALADFDKAISYAPQLRKEKQGDTLAANRMLAALWQRKAAVLGITGQYDAALAGITEAERQLPATDNSPLGGLIQTERGRYLTMKDKLTDADSSYRKAIRAYEKLSYAEPGIRLTIVELSVLTGQYDRAQQALTNLPTEQIREGYDVLKEYLAACLAVLKEGQPGPQALEGFTAYLAKHPAKIYGWSFDLFDNWLTKSKLPTDKRAALRQLTDTTKERLVRPQ
ncbi:leucine-rich repeat domain-containing protein [Spirosoma areae]